MDKQYFVYILANHKCGTLYTGVTGDLLGRIFQHKAKLDPRSFTARYGVDKLVYYEVHEDPYEAICREKQIKNLVRRKKIAIIEKTNPEWKDLYNDL